MYCVTDEENNWVADLIIGMALYLKMKKPCVTPQGITLHVAMER